MPQPNFQQQQQNNPNMMQRMPHQGPPGMNNLSQGGNFAGNQQRMSFTQGQQNQMVVGQSGPSPGSGGQMVVSNPGLSPFGPNSAGMTPPNSTAQQMLSNRPIMSPSNDFNPNMMHVKQQQQQTMNSQAPSPFNSQSNQNVFNSNMMMQNSQRMMPPTPTSDMIPVPSPSPSLNSNGPPPPVSTPNTPNVASLFSRPEPTPPMMPTPSPSHAGKGQNFGGSMSGGNITNSNVSGQGEIKIIFFKLKILKILNFQLLTQ